MEINAKPKKFPGGIHPYEGKELSASCTIEVLPPPKIAVIPLSQHIGAPAQVQVEKGQEVKAGQEIGSPGGFVSVPVHSPITGKVIAIEKRPHPIFNKALSIVIQAEGNQDEIMTFDPPGSEASSEQIREAINKAGIAGMGGAAFPTHVKLSPPENKPIDTFILNGVECEPYLTADDRLMIEQTDKIIKGLKILMRGLKVEKGLIGIEANKPKAIGIMQRLTEKENQIQVVPLRVRYPQGAEKQLIYALTGRKVPAGGLPMDIGVVVNNVGTAFAVAEAVLEGKPLIERTVTVTGKGIKKPKNLKVRIGSLFSDLIEYAGGLDNEVGKVIMGGPMMGIAQERLDVPVIKGCSGILCLLHDEVVWEHELPCIRCGRCVEVCPMRLAPSILGNAGEFRRVDLGEEYGAMDCIECGCCAYICPAKRHLVHYVKYLKAEILAKRKKQN